MRDFYAWMESATIKIGNLSFAEFNPSHLAICAGAFLFRATAEERSIV